MEGENGHTPDRMTIQNSTETAPVMTYKTILTCLVSNCITVLVNGKLT